MKQVWPAASVRQTQLPLIQTDDLPADLTRQWQMNLLAVLLPFCKMEKKDLCLLLSLNYFVFFQQDSEKNKRLRDAIKAQTDYTIAVSILNQF